MTTNDDDMVTSPLSELDSEAMLDLQLEEGVEGGDADADADPNANGDTNDSKDTNDTNDDTNNRDTSPTTGANTGDPDSKASVVGDTAGDADNASKDDSGPVVTDGADVVTDGADGLVLASSLVSTDGLDANAPAAPNGRKSSLLNPADLSDDSSELSELEDSEAETERLYLNDLVDEEEESFKRRRESSSEDHIRQMKRERQEEDGRDTKRARVNGGHEEGQEDAGEEEDPEEDTTARMEVDTTARAEEEGDGPDGPDTGLITAGAIASALQEAAPPLPLVEEAQTVENGAEPKVETEAKVEAEPARESVNGNDEAEITKDMPTPMNQTEPSDNEHEEDEKEDREEVKEEVKEKQEKEEEKQTVEEGEDDGEEEEEEVNDDNDDNDNDDNDDKDSGNDDNSGKDSGNDNDKVDMRPAAMTSLAEIEVDFAKLRDFMFKEKLAAFEVEMGLCVKGTHPELHAVYEQISKLRDDKIQLAKTRRKYKLQCINNQTRASRVQVHQQFLKDQGDARSGLLLKTTEEWYRVNRERRAMDLMVPDYGYTIPESKSEQIHQRNAQVSEISLLSGISKHVGFPAAPVISQATEDETLEDLTALGLQRPPVPHAAFAVPPGIMPMAVSLPQQQQQSLQQSLQPQQASQPSQQPHQQPQQLQPPPQQPAPPPQPHSAPPPPHTQGPMGQQHRLNGHEQQQQQQQHMPLPLGAPLMMQHPMYHQGPPIYGGYQYPGVPYYQGGNLLPPPQTMYGHPQMYGQVLPPPYMYQKREEDDK